MWADIINNDDVAAIFLFHFFLFAVHDVYWEIIRLRKNIALARLGLALSSWR